MRVTTAEEERAIIRSDALDRALLDAYGWPHELGDEELLARLLALNLERAG